MPLDALIASLRPGGGDFERLCKWLLENAPEYRSRLTKVWLWQDWPGRWGADAGIDLVAEDRDGGFWAVQAKHYDPAYAIKKADIDSFLSESSRPGFSYRLLIATTDHVGPTARRTLAAQEKRRQRPGGSRGVLVPAVEFLNNDVPREPGCHHGAENGAFVPAQSQGRLAVGGEAVRDGHLEGGEPTRRYGATRPHASASALTSGK